MKIYAASLVGMRPLADASETIVFSVPALIPADSMQEAAERCQEACFERWQPEAGFHTWQANIMPVTEQFYQAAFQAHDQGIIDTQDEPGQTFNFMAGDAFEPVQVIAEWPEVVGDEQEEDSQQASID